MTADEVSNLLYSESGLFGVSGISDDVRTLLTSDDQSAKEAFGLFVYCIGRDLRLSTLMPFGTSRTLFEHRTSALTHLNPGDGTWQLSRRWRRLLFQGADVVRQIRYLGLI